MNRAIFFLAIVAGIHTMLYSQSQSNIPELNFNEFEHFLHNQGDTVYVINFWATWCIPCRKELPEFEKIDLKYKHEKVKVLLVSLDFPSPNEKELMTFLKSHNITCSVLLLDDPNSNAWIDKVDASWSGSIPATLIYKQNSRYFFEKELDYEFLNYTIDKMMN
jgi:thiol-disulfide isomerase/thioredoxin